MISFIFSILIIIATWKVFTKAGEAGWKSLIPIYNTYVLFKIAKSENFGNLIFASVGSSFLYVFSFLLLMAEGKLETAFGVILLVAGTVLAILALVITFQMYADLAKNFGYEKAFAWGLLFLNPIFMLILGFGKSEYTLDSEVASSTEKPEDESVDNSNSEEISHLNDADIEEKEDTEKERGDTMAENTTKELDFDRKHEEDLQRLRGLRLLDDDFMQKVFEDKACTELLLQIILKRADLKVLHVKGQQDIKNLQGRSCFSIILSFCD